MVFLIRIILIWWLISVIMRWYRSNKSKDTKMGSPYGPEKNTDFGLDLNGTIEDAEFEELDEK